MSIFPIVMLVFQMVKRYNSFPCSCVFGPAKGGGSIMEDVVMMSLCGLHSSVWRVRCGMSRIGQTFRLSFNC